MPPRRLLTASGQASVELVALLPLLAAVALLAWQGVVAGQAIWLSGAAARAAARAFALGDDPTAAARSSVRRRTWSTPCIATRASIDAPL